MKKIVRIGIWCCVVALCLLLFFRFYRPRCSCCGVTSDTPITFSTLFSKYTCEYCKSGFLVPLSYTALECGCSDVVSGADHNLEYTFWKDTQFADTQAKKKITVNINGEDICGEYQYSRNQAPDNYTSHFYKTAVGKLFAVDPSGVPVQYTWSAGQTGEKSDQSYTEQQCVDVAGKFLRQYVNVEDYTVSTSYENAKKAYEVTFRKHLNGYETTDCAVVTVLENGELYSFSSNMLGKVPNTAAIEFDYDEVFVAVDRKLIDIYSNIFGGDTYFDGGEPLLQYTVLENGKPALYCISNARVVFNDTFEIMYEETVFFIVEL